MDKRERGRRGEDTAEQYFKELGYLIVQRNYYTRYGEIDIIAKDGDFLVFTEVKKRTNDRFGTGAEAVTQKKIEKIRLTASLYLQKNGGQDEKVRFDVVEISGHEGEKINHIKAAF